MARRGLALALLGLVSLAHSACGGSGDAGATSAAASGGGGKGGGGEGGSGTANSGAASGSGGAPWEPLELCINELMPVNDSSAVDESGATPDWIELHNPGATDIDLAGWSLTDDPAVPKKSVLPSGLALPAGGFLVLWADDQVVMSPTHLSFKLGGDGGAVGVFAPDGRGSVVKHGAIDADFSAARSPDCCSGESCFKFDYRGSPGQSNVELTFETVELLPPGSVYRYLDTGIAPPDWMAPGFVDSAWLTGAAPLGYGDPHIVTNVSFGADAANKYVTTWFRTAFDVADSKAVVEASLKILRDDGARAFLNGAEVARSNLPPGDINAATQALIGAGNAEETSFFGFVIDPALLVTGTNVLAIEVHQAGVSSSDLGMDAAFSVKRAAPPK